MLDGQKLVAFLDNMMGCTGPRIKIDMSVPKDATEAEIASHCEKNGCVDCAILQRCSLAAKLFKSSVVAF